MASAVASRCLDGGLASRLGGASCLFAGRSCRLGRFSQSLSVLANGFQRLPVLVAELARLFREPPEALRFHSRGLIDGLNGLGSVATVVGVTAAVFADLPHVLCLLAILLSALSANFRLLAETFGRCPVARWRMPRVRHSEPLF